VAVYQGREGTCELACTFADTGTAVGMECPDGMVCEASGSSCPTCKDEVFHCVVAP